MIAVPIPNPKLSKDKMPIKGELPSAINPSSGRRFRICYPSTQELCEQVEPQLRSFGKYRLTACRFLVQPLL